MKKSFVTLVALAMTFFAAAAHADARGDGGNDFYNLIETLRQACVSGCQAPFESKTTFDIQEPKNATITTDLKADLQNVADSQAQVWGDTILEGDYHSDGKTQLDFVAALYKDSKLIGYKITYSENAWYTGDCEFDEADDATLKDCTAGRILESSFVSLDFKTFFRDEDHFADFKESAAKP